MTPQTFSKTLGVRPGFSLVLSTLACATCPVCLGAMAGMSSLLGLGFSLEETWHRPLVLLSVGAAWLSLSTAAWKGRRPLIWGLATLGGIAVLLSELVATEQTWLGHFGYGLLVGLSLYNWRASRRKHDGCCDHSSSHRVEQAHFHKEH